MVFYRIAQEAINNIIKHASASTLFVRLRMREGNVEMSIKDNGIGFDPLEISRGFGKVSMYERAQSIDAALTIKSSVGNGTTVAVSWIRENEPGEKHA